MPRSCLPTLHRTARSAPRRRFSSTPSLSSWQLTVKTNALSTVQGTVNESEGAAISALAFSAPREPLNVLHDLRLFPSPLFPFTREDVDPASVQVRQTSTGLEVCLSTKPIAAVTVQSISYLLSEQKRAAEEAVAPYRAELQEHRAQLNEFIRISAVLHDYQFAIDSFKAAQKAVIELALRRGIISNDDPLVGRNSEYSYLLKKSAEITFFRLTDSDFTAFRKACELFPLPHLNTQQERTARTLRDRALQQLLIFLHLPEVKTLVGAAQAWWDAAQATKGERTDNAHPPALESKIDLVVPSLLKANVAGPNVDVGLLTSLMKLHYRKGPTMLDNCGAD